ncbi:MAG TPA: 50S ribosomal protein L4 [Clostridiales bacterium]|jgi:large subunit ribosomal protein L4|nr:50S ribosomal protein L4 [Clostridiales bacterium]
MPTVALLDMTGKKIGDIELNDYLFGITPNVHVMHLVVKAHLANRRQGTQSALTRSEVRGGGKKPWRQKGTGRARHGSIRAPQWRHGGVVFAPKPRDYRMSINKKVRRLALRSALSSKVISESIIVLDNLDIKEAKTREMAKVLEALNTNNALIVLPEKTEKVELAARNIPHIETTLVSTLNVYDILKHKQVILTKDALAKVEEVYVQ